MAQDPHINPASGVWDDNYYAKTYGSGGSSSSSGGSSLNFDDIVKKTIELQKQANQPAVDSLNASIPEINTQYSGAIQRAEGQRKPLEDRYANLIGEIKGNQTSSENRQTVSTRNELGRRGLVGGGLYDQTLTDAVNPITQQYTGMLKDTGIAQEQGLASITDLIANLTGQQVNATRGVQNSIAQLQSGAASTGIQQGIGQYNTQVQQAEQQRQAEENARQQAIQNALAQSQQNFAQQQYNQITLPESKLQQQTLQKQLSKVTGGVSGSGASQYYGNTTTSNPVQSGRYTIVNNGNKG